MFFTCNVFLHGESPVGVGQKFAGIEYDVIHRNRKSCDRQYNLDQYRWERKLGGNEEQKGLMESADLRS